MQNLILALLILSLAMPGYGADCLNKIAKSEVPDAINGLPGAGAKVCGAADPCICYDGIQFDAAQWDGNSLTVDQAKLAAKQTRKSQEAAAAATRKTTNEARKAALRAHLVKLRAGTITAAEKA